MQECLHIIEKFQKHHVLLLSKEQVGSKAPTKINVRRQQ